MNDKLNDSISIFIVFFKIRIDDDFVIAVIA